MRADAQSEAQKQNMSRMIEHLSGRALPALEQCWEDIKKDAPIGVQLQIWYKIGLLNWDSGNKTKAYGYFNDCFFHAESVNATLGPKTISQLSEEYLQKYGDGYDDRLHEEEHLSSIANSVEKEQILINQARQQSNPNVSQEQRIMVYEGEGSLTLPARTTPIADLPPPNNPMQSRSKSRPSRVNQAESYDRVMILDRNDQPNNPAQTVDYSSPVGQRTKKSAFGIKRYTPKMATQNTKRTTYRAPNPSVSQTRNPQSFKPSIPQTPNPSIPQSSNPSAAPSSPYVVTFYYSSGTTNNEYTPNTTRKKAKAFKVRRRIRK